MRGLQATSQKFNSMLLLFFKSHPRNLQRNPRRSICEDLAFEMLRCPPKFLEVNWGFFLFFFFSFFTPPSSTDGSSTKKTSGLVFCHSPSTRLWCDTSIFTLGYKCGKRRFKFQGICYKTKHKRHHSNERLVIMVLFPTQPLLLHLLDHSVDSSTSLEHPNSQWTGDAEGALSFPRCKNLSR